MKRTRPWELSDELWERARPSMIAFGSGKSKGCLSASGKQGCRNMMSWKGLPGNGKAWMGY
jgi:hypothetical protein